MRCHVDIFPYHLCGRSEERDKPEQNEGKDRVVRYEKYYILQETELACVLTSHIKIMGNPKMQSIWKTVKVVL
jgi:hypothetical protein